MIELQVFRLAPGADEKAFLDADKAVQSDFAYQQPGLLRRTTARSPSGDWLVLDVWRSEADADAAAIQWANAPAAREFMGFVDRATVRTARFEELG